MKYLENKENKEKNGARPSSRDGELEAWRQRRSMCVTRIDVIDLTRSTILGYAIDVTIDDPNVCTQ